jgi:hypothetical protein
VTNCSLNQNAVYTITDGGGGTTGSMTPSSIADGGFVSVLTKVIDNETIAVDLFTTTTSLSKFNSATAFGNTVQTPDTAQKQHNKTKKTKHTPHPHQHRTKKTTKKIPNHQQNQHPTYQT